MESTKSNKIHTIGDSHSYFGWDNIPNVTNHYLCDRLCHSVGRDGLDLCAPEYKIESGETLIFCFGEIDCRCHVNKHIRPDFTYMEVIDNIVTKYFAQVKIAVDNLYAKSGVTDIRVCIYNIVPAVRKSTTCENKSFPFLGSDADRKSYTLYFNTRLKELCVEYGFIFFDVYDKYICADGFIKRELSDGHVHIKNGIHIREFIDNSVLSYKERCFHVNL